jgi:cytochrome c peroxidase
MSTLRDTLSLYRELLTSRERIADLVQTFDSSWGDEAAVFENLNSIIAVFGRSEVFGILLT